MLNNSSILITGNTLSFGHSFGSTTLRKNKPQRLVLRNEIARPVNGNDQPRKIPQRQSATYSSFHPYRGRISGPNYGDTQRKICDSLVQKSAANLLCSSVLCHPFYEGLCFKPQDVSEAEDFRQEIFSLPIYPILKNEELGLAVQILGELFR